MKALCESGERELDILRSCARGKCWPGLEKIRMEDIVARGGNGVYSIRQSDGIGRHSSGPETPAKPFLDFAADVSYFPRLSVRKTAEFVFSKDKIGERILDLLDVTALISVEPFPALVRIYVDLQAVRNSGKQSKLWLRNGITAISEQVLEKCSPTRK